MSKTLTDNDIFPIKPFPYECLRCGNVQKGTISARADYFPRQVICENCGKRSKADRPSYGDKTIPF